MITHDVKPEDEKKQECFLCSLDPGHHCEEAQIEGRIVAVQERLLDGVKVPVVILDTGTARVDIYLDHSYYQTLMRNLKRIGDVLGSSNLKLRIYHLPEAPVRDEVKGTPRLRYKANAYTLAVLEPNILLNITDLNQAEYCPRQYMLHRLIPSTTSPATIRGNLIHYCFKELLKGHASSKFTSQPQPAEEASTSALTELQHHLDKALRLNSVEMALADISNEVMRADVIPHLESLAHWYESERNTLWDMPSAYSDQVSEESDTLAGNQVRAETFLLAPEIGLRGRLDLFWQQSGRQRLLELKTGGTHGMLPKREHRWQVYGYHALLTVRRNSKMKRALATLLYSGTPTTAQAFGIPATIREIQRVNETRNTLVLGRVTNVPPPPPGPSRCSKCAMLEQCQTISSLLQWQPPEPDLKSATPDDDIEESIPPPAPTIFVPSDSKEDRVFFATYYHLLHKEGRAGEQQQALLWTMPVTERIERGTAVSGLTLEDRPSIENDGWTLTFRCTNTSELREGDEILLSNGNPITGEVVSGTITAISSERVMVWTRELIAHPTLIDRYDNDLIHIRTLQNLLRWQRAPLHIRDLVAGRVHPRFLGEVIAPRPDFNHEQNLAVERALQMQDYLLIHGPPGTGKTSVIAEIVKRLTQRKQRVMLAAFTNQAVDNMLKRLDREGFHSYLRLGHERSVDEAVRPHILKTLIEASINTTQATGDALQEQMESSSYAIAVRDLLYTIPVVASTTATWSSDKYVPSSPQQDNTQDNLGLSFDVAIIDEAGQLTIPAILGALRFARRFILVGDEKQLPPLVLSKEAAAEGLSDSLFSKLKEWDDDYTQTHPMAISACIPLRTQYRMNRWIANFSSTVFYDKQLQAHATIANKTLRYLPIKASIHPEEEAITQILQPQFPLVFLDVRDQQRGSTETKLSNAEAQAVRSIVAGLLARGIAPQDIGIIAPYRAQVANIRRHLFSADVSNGWLALQADSPLSIDTVDRFQGGERKVIIISFATTHEPALESARREFMMNPHRLNVALTRAQHKLILVGCVRALEPLTLFSRLIAYCRSMKTLITATPEVMPTP